MKKLIAGSTLLLMLALAANTYAAGTKVPSAKSKTEISHKESKKGEERKEAAKHSGKHHKSYHKKMKK